MNHSHADDFVLATGVIHTVRQFLEMALHYLNIEFYWKDNECFEKNTDKLISTTDTKHLRPAEVDVLQGDATKAKNELGWQPKHDVESIMADMVEADMKRYYKK